MKTIDFSPTDKLVQVFLSVLTGCESLSVVNTRLRPERKLAQVLGNESFAHHLLQIPGTLVFEGEKLKRIDLLAAHPYAEAMLICLEKYCSTAFGQ